MREMGINTKLFLPLMAFIFVFVMVGFVSSANVVNVTLPANTSSISGTVTVTGNISGDQMHHGVNMSFYYLDPDGSSWTLINHVANTSANQTGFSTTWDTTGVTDDEAFQFQANATDVSTAGSASGTVNATKTRGGYSVDNGNPTATISSASIHNDYNIVSTDTFTFGLDADSSIGISNCTLYCTNIKGGTTVSTTVSGSGNACTSSTLKPSDLGMNKGDAYNCLLMAEDENIDRTNSSTRRLNVLTSTAGGGGSSSNAQQGVTASGIAQSIASPSTAKGFVGSIGDFFKTIWDVISFKWLRD